MTLPQGCEQYRKPVFLQVLTFVFCINNTFLQFIPLTQRQVRKTDIGEGKQEQSSTCSIANQHSLLRTITAALFQGLVQSNYQQTKLISEKRENWKGFHWVLTGIQTFAVSSLKKFCIFSKCHVHSYLQMNSDCSFLPYNSS